jgi:DNA-binding PadR family transcriptional regulator
MSKRRVSNPLALAVLSCLWERPMYPYEMTTSLRERGKEDSIRLNFGSLYAVIKSLAKHGLIEATHTEREGNRPERIVYAITAAGKVEAVDWLRELIAQPVKEYPAFETGLSLMPMLRPDEATTLLGDRVVRLAADLAERERLMATPEVAGLPELFLVEASYRMAMMRAESAFVTDLVERLSSGEFGGVGLWARLHELLDAGHPWSEIDAEFAHYLATDTGDEEADSPT